jgi:coproporphyrinogen III oxidase-like Fe-S oxidoreductase
MKFVAWEKSSTSTFTFSPDIEASVEVDPRRLTRDHLVALREIGFNRASMGVQDFNPRCRRPYTASSHVR